jgi:hypothetical protein
MILLSANHDRDVLRTRYALIALAARHSSHISYNANFTTPQFLSDVKPHEHSRGHYDLQRLN